jgi:hypothetical protein
MPKPLFFPACLALATLLLQCARPPAEPKTPSPEDLIHWNHAAEQAKGPTRIVISLNEQRVAIFKGKELLGLSPISSGREGHDTHPGQFSVIEKDRDHSSSCYGSFVDKDNFIVVEDVDVRRDKAPPGTHFMGAPMAWFIRFNGGIGMHQGNLPGFPASHGCIRLPGNMAYRLYEHCKVGTPVEVQRNAKLLALLPAPQPAGSLRKLKAMPQELAGGRTDNNPQPQPASQATAQPRSATEDSSPPIAIAPTTTNTTSPSSPNLSPLLASQSQSPSRPQGRGFFGGIFARNQSRNASSTAKPATPATAQPKPAVLAAKPEPKPVVEPVKPNALAASKPAAKPEPATARRGFFGSLFARQTKPAEDNRPAPAAAKPATPATAQPKPAVLAAKPEPKPVVEPVKPNALAASKPAVKPEPATARRGFFGSLFARQTKPAEDNRPAPAAAKPATPATAQPKPAVLAAKPEPKPVVEPVKPNALAASKPAVKPEPATARRGFFGSLFARASEVESVQAATSASRGKAAGTATPARAVLAKVAASSEPMLRPITPEVPGIPAAPRSYQPEMPNQEAPTAKSAKGYLVGRLSDREDVVISPHAPYGEVDVAGLPAGSLAVDPISNKVFEVPGGHLPAKATRTPGIVTSPYRPHSKVDVSGMASGSLAIDPTTQRVFVVP